MGMSTIALFVFHVTTSFSSGGQNDRLVDRSIRGVTAGTFVTILLVSRVQCHYERGDPHNHYCSSGVSTSQQSICPYRIKEEHRSPESWT